MTAIVSARSRWSLGLSLSAAMICVLLLGINAIGEFVNVFLVNLSGRIFGDYEAEIGVLDSVFYLLLTILGVVSGLSVVRTAKRRTTGRSRLGTIGRCCVAMNALFGVTATSLALWRVLLQYLESGATP